MLKSTVINRIRHIFLHQRPHVSIVGWTRGDMKAAIAAGEILLKETPLGKWGLA